jgi:oxygen-independent coproporphyrinogen-3 oxidase
MVPPSNQLSQITIGGQAGEGQSGADNIASIIAVPTESAVVDDLSTAPAGLYLHVPFCFHKCHYCDFYSIVDSRERQAAFTQRMIKELEASRAYFRTPIETIFVGGGTPTLLKPELWGDLLKSIDRVVHRGAEVEFTVEANPETVTPDLMRLLADGGVNRISIGAQSFDPRHLKTLERWHEPASVRRAAEVTRAAGIDNISLDLIFGIPGQTLDDWRSDLDAALAIEPMHLSCYGLMYEPNTPLTQRMRSGAIQPIEDDTEASMYEATIDRLGEAGFEHYEISNWAKPARRCRHNLIYWQNRQWWPIGPSASGHVAGWRWKNVPRLGRYLEQGPLPPIEDAEHLDEDGRVGEELMLGLRLTEGIEQSRLDALLSVGT